MGHFRVHSGPREGHFGSPVKSFLLLNSIGHHAIIWVKKEKASGKGQMYNLKMTEKCIDSEIQIFSPERGCSWFSSNNFQHLCFLLRISQGSLQPHLFLSIIIIKHDSNSKRPENYEEVLSPYLWKVFETRRIFFGIWPTEEIHCEKCDPQNWGVKSLRIFNKMIYAVDDFYL